ncbi:MAG TPA: hypothetical protein VJ749_00150 [Pyrinomonadaceae bacterium]|nr:hypothetical protein [Pyrinomonadaceae bacterium]
MTEHLLFALVARDELRKAALAAVRCRVLMKKREIVLVEDLEELLPLDRFEFASPENPG